MHIYPVCCQAILLSYSFSPLGLSILRSDHDRVRLKLRGNTRTVKKTSICFHRCTQCVYIIFYRNDHISFFEVTILDFLQLLATFRLQKKANTQQWRLSQDMSAEAVLHAWTTGNVSPDAVKLPSKRKSDDADLENTKTNIKMLHQQVRQLLELLKKFVKY